MVAAVHLVERAHSREAHDGLAAGQEELQHRDGGRKLAGGHVAQRADGARGLQRVELIACVGAVLCAWSVGTLVGWFQLRLLQIEQVNTPETATRRSCHAHQLPAMATAFWRQLLYKTACSICMTHLEDDRLALVPQAALQEVVKRAGRAVRRRGRVRHHLGHVPAGDIDSTDPHKTLDSTG